MMTAEEQARRALMLADMAAVEEIEGCSATVDEHGRTWYDTRPLLDPREVPDQVADISRLRLQYARDRGLASPHPVHSYLLRITHGRAL